MCDMTRSYMRSDSFICMWQGASATPVRTLSKYTHMYTHIHIPCGLPKNGRTTCALHTFLCMCTHTHTCTRSYTCLHTRIHIPIQHDIAGLPRNGRRMCSLHTCYRMHTHTCTHLYTIIHIQQGTAGFPRNGKRTCSLHTCYTYTRTQMCVHTNIHIQQRIAGFPRTGRRAFTDYCIWSVISPASNLNWWSCSLGFFCHVPLKRDWDWRLRLNDTPNAVGYTGWRRPIGFLKLQIIFKKEPLSIGLFCGEWIIKIRHPMHVRHPGLCSLLVSCASPPEKSWCI